MRQIILAVQTPRAGKWNHRWIVPDGCQTDDVTLKGALSKFDALNSGSIHKDGIVFYRSVEQPSSGRFAREFIFLYFPDFRDVVSSHGKTQCFNAMNAFFESRMDQLINSIDWDNTDGAMIYHSPELAALFNDVEQAIQQNPEQSKGANERGDNKRSGCSGCFRFLLALIVILAAALYFCHGKIQEWLNQHSEQIQKILDDAVNNNANQNENKPSSGNSNVLSGKLSSEEYKEWQKLFTLPADEQNESKRYELVQAAVNAAFTYCYGTVPKEEDETSISTMMQNPNSFALSLYKARDTQQPYRFKDDSGVTDAAFTIMPKEFRQAINEFHNINNSTIQLLESIPDPTDYVSNLKFVLNSAPDYIREKSWSVSDIKGYDINPVFFFDSDKEIIDNISKEYFTKVDEQLNNASSSNLPENEKKIINDFRQKWNESKNNYFNLFNSSK